MKYTKNYKLQLPDGSDLVSPVPFNDNFSIIDEALHNAASKVPEHTHSAEDIIGQIPAEKIAPGTFVGDFAFQSSGDTEIALQTTRDSRNRSASLQVHRDQGRLDITSFNSGTQFSALRLWGYTSGHSAALELIRPGSETDEDTYGIYSELFRPIVSGGYTGNGSSARTISLGFKPTFLIVWASDIKLTQANILAFLFPSDRGKQSFVLGSPSGTVTWNTYSYILSGSKLDISGTGIANHLNASGVSYYYWGVRE